MSTKKYYVKNCIMMSGVTYAKGEPIEVDVETAKSLFSSGSITRHKPQVVEKEVFEDNVGTVNPFADIGLNQKQADILVKEGYTDLEKLSEVEEETLANIHGISKALAKQINNSFTEE